MIIEKDVRTMAMTFAKGYELPGPEADVIRQFVPADRLAYELFKSKGVVPAGYMSQAMVSEICPSCGDEMRKADLPLIAEDYFSDVIGMRVASDIHNNSDAWAKAVQNEEGLSDIIKGFVDDADDYDFEKAKAGLHQKTVTVHRGGKTFQRSSSRKADLPQILEGESLDIVDFLKAHPSAAIQGWAEKMKKEGGEHPFDWCQSKATFTKDPDAFCAAVHMAAYGKTPSQRKASKTKAC